MEWGVLWLKGRNKRREGDVVGEVFRLALGFDLDIDGFCVGRGVGNLI